MPIKHVEGAYAAAARAGAAIASIARSAKRMGKIIRLFSDAAKEHEEELRRLFDTTDITREQLAYYAARGWTPQALIYFYLEYGKLPHRNDEEKP